MKIALLHYSYAPVIGGVETIVAEHARIFAAKGHEVRIICQRGSASDPRIRVEVLEAGDAGAAKLAPLLAEVDVLFVHNVLTMPFDPAWTAALWRLAVKLPAVRFIAWIHDLAACNPDYEVERGSLTAQACAAVEYVAISEFRRAQFEELTGAGCRVIPNGIDPARLLELSENVTALAQRHGLLTREFVLLHPARLLRRKNIELSLRVTAELLAGGHDCCLLVTGPPDSHQSASAAYALSLRELRQELGLEHDALFLHDHFAVTERDLSSLFVVADALFFPSRQEGFGLPILEAALHRLPIFCANIEPTSSLVGGALHPFLSSSHPSIIAARIAETLQFSHEFRARKSAVRDHSWSAIFDKFLAPLLAEDAS